MALDTFQFQIDKGYIAIQLHYFLKGTNKPVFNVGTLLIFHFLSAIENGFFPTTNRK